MQRHPGTRDVAGATPGSASRHASGPRRRRRFARVGPGRFPPRIRKARDVHGDRSSGAGRRPGSRVAETGSLAQVPRIPERSQPVREFPATVCAPPRPSLPERHLVARIAWRGAAVQVGSLPACATPAGFLSVGERPDTARSDAVDPLRTNSCKLLAFSRSGAAPADWQTVRKQRKSGPRRPTAACALDNASAERTPIDLEVDDRAAQHGSESVAVRQVRAEAPASWPAPSKA